jgi:hypothetical protein
MDKLSMIVELIRNNSAAAKLTRTDELTVEPIALTLDEIASQLESLKRFEEYHDICIMDGSQAKYLFSDQRLTRNYAKMLARVEDKDLMTLIAESVRDESRIYPRPTKVTFFADEPFRLAGSDFDLVLEQMQANPAYSDIKEFNDSNGNRYLCSEQHLSMDHAYGLAEWKIMQEETP